MRGHKERRAGNRGACARARADRECYGTVVGVSRTAGLPRCLWLLARCAGAAARLRWSGDGALRQVCTGVLILPYTPAEGTVRYTVRSLQVQPGAQVSASALVLRLRQQRAARAAARKAPDALERKTVALDGDHVQRARAVRLDGQG